MNIAYALSVLSELRCAADERHYATLPRELGERERELAEHLRVQVWWCLYAATEFVKHAGELHSAYLALLEGEEN